MRVGDSVKLTKESPVDFGVKGFGFVITKPYAYVITQDEVVTETKVTDVLFGTKIVEKIPLDCLQIIF
jgi:hypothetical protein